MNEKIAIWHGMAFGIVVGLYKETDIETMYEYELSTKRRLYEICVEEGILTYLPDWSDENELHNNDLSEITVVEQVQRFRLGDIAFNRISICERSRLPPLVPDEFVANQIFLESSMSHTWSFTI